MRANKAELKKVQLLNLNPDVFFFQFMALRNLRKGPLLYFLVSALEIAEQLFDITLILPRVNCP